jgi:hypothetical protein
VLLGVAIIIGAAFMRTDATASSDLEDPRTFVAALPLREYQETKDSDGDGLRDWFEELAGSDPALNDALRASSSLASPTTTPFIADTETEKFAVAFFEEVLTTHGGKNLSDEEKKAILDSSLRKFKTLNTDTLFTRADITITEARDDEAIRAYGNAAGLAIMTHGNTASAIDSEIVLLGAALSEDDPSHLEGLSLIRLGYDRIIADVRAITVPEPVIDEHLLLLNALTAVRDDVVGFEKTFDDPLVSYVRFKRYFSDADALAKAVEGIRKELEGARAVYQNDEPGSFFFSLRP